MSAAISDLTAHTGYWMRMISNAVSQDFARRVAGEGVTVAEWVFLRALYDERSLSPSLLATKMGMTKGAISKLADRLMEKGLVSRTEDEADRRAHHLALSAEGRAKVPQLAALADANDAEAFGVLSAEDRAELDRLLKLLVERRGLSAVPID
ncbi:DNA-binding transcriptional regulator, MarR family [Ensifer adhaerens]|nr:DNA-binding transcriptional regulator, MarR family [Ensifer adhaerens]